MASAEQMTIAELSQGKVPLPSCPMIFTRLVEAINGGETNCIEIADIISMDMALTAELLKVANSAYYGMSKTVRTVNEATLYLGFNEVFSIATSLKSKDLFRSKNAGNATFRGLLWQHSMATGILCANLAKWLLPQNADFLLTAGILHDIGKLVLVEAVPEYLTLSNLGATYGKELVKAEAATLKTTHATLGGELLTLWHFPQVLVKHVAHHHDIEVLDERMRRSCRILAMADQIAHDLESGSVNFDKPIDNTIARMGLDLNMWPMICSRSKDQYASYMNFN